MAKTAAEPLTTDDLKRINRSLRQLHDLVVMLDKCEKAGQDCTELRESVAYLLRRLTGYKEQFFPGT